MSITKAQARSRVIAFMDATGSSRWDVTPNAEVDQAIGYAADQEWRTILDANPNYKAQSIQTVVPVGGQVLKTSLSTGSADTARRLYKILGLYINNTPFRIEQYGSDYFGATLLGTQPYVAYEFGDFYQVLPASLAGTQSIWFVNYLPQRQDGLANEASVFQFPDSFEDVALLEAAAYLLASKAGAEVDAATPLVGLAKKRRTDMLRSLGSATTAPLEVKYTDASQDWGQ